MSFDENESFDAFGDRIINSIMNKYKNKRKYRKRTMASQHNSNRSKRAKS